MNRDLCGGGPTAERPLRGEPSVLRRTVSGWRHSKGVPLRRCGSAAIRAFDARRKRMLSRRILAASSILGQTEHTFYRFRFCSQVGKIGLFLLCFASVPPKPYAAQRRRASVVLRRRGNLITGNAAMRRCPFGEMAGGAKNAFWMVRALCVVVHLKKWLTQRCIPRTTCAAARRRASVVLECRISLFTGNAAVRRCPFGRKRVGAKISPRTTCAA